MLQSISMDLPIKFSVSLRPKSVHIPFINPRELPEESISVMINAEKQIIIFREVYLVATLQFDQLSLGMKRHNQKCAPSKIA